MIKHIFVATVMWLVLGALRVPMMLLGLVVLPVALLFRHTMESDRGGMGWDGWHLVRLPWWAWPWDNLRDGAMGDTQGRYWLRDAPGWLPGRFWKMWWWLAIRNPANNFSRFMRPNAVDVRYLKIALLAGDWVVKKSDWPRWQFVVGRGPVFNYYGLYCLIPFRGGHINIRLGHKIEPKHQVQDFTADPQKAIKGFTLRILFDR